MVGLLWLLTAALAAPSAQSLRAAAPGLSSRGRSTQFMSPVSEHVLLFPQADGPLDSELADLAPRVMFGNHTPEVQESWRNWQFNASSVLNATLLPNQQAPLHILVVTYVANTQSDSERWGQNVKLLQGNMANDLFYFVVFHYDGQNSNFTEQPWYNDSSVVMHFQHNGCKPMFWYYLDDVTFVDDYDYVWFMDSDLTLDFFSWDLYRNVLGKLRPLVSQPSVIPMAPSARSTDLGSLKGRPQFRNGSFEIVRLNHRSEVMTPVIDTRIWPAIRKRLQGNDRKNCWFIDTWWDLIALLDKQSCGGPGIIVVNGSPVRHMDTHALESAKSNATGCIRGSNLRGTNNRPLSQVEVYTVKTTLCKEAWSILKNASLLGQHLQTLAKTMRFPRSQDNWTLEGLMGAETVS